MSHVAWDKRARSDLSTAITYIAARNPDAAQSLKSMIETATERLSAFPYLHRVGRTPGTREMVVHPNYIVIYRVETNVIRILRVLHARQHYP
ncbi:addiction module antitoxin [Brevundimonas sp. LM2]|uniref:type II toxin-antitoxin system RelE/ParE family toxin n=1 Tax=Brevundimonas sp. LM2 TaxID=1938605 RepID=UPI0009840132|nr:type II toxin-antitoxin system mRNA interferase toxin, RelE/StbE family [Brevundimonas sp. LM2]AQR60480.1 addiction module antitoxin [Brevundimonas sp. LM2]